MKLKQTERLRTLLVAAGMACMLYLFYRSFWVMPLILPGMVVYRKIRKKELQQIRTDVLGRQFRDMLESLAASLRVGYSMENALKECVGEMELMYGVHSEICEELAVMLNQFHLGMSAEDVFRDFAGRSRAEDIATFAAVYSIAKQAGGDMVEIIRRTSDSIAGRIETRNEIAVLISSRKLEQTIMTLIPAGMIVYIDLTSGGLLDPLYGNPVGILIMTVCLAVYILAMLLGKKLVQIDV